MEVSNLDSFRMTPWTQTNLLSVMSCCLLACRLYLWLCVLRFLLRLMPTALRPSFLSLFSFSTSSVSFLLSQLVFCGELSHLLSSFSQFQSFSAWVILNIWPIQLLLCAWFGVYARNRWQRLQLSFWYALCPCQRSRLTHQSEASTSWYRVRSWPSYVQGIHASTSVEVASLSFSISIRRSSIHWLCS